VAFEAAYGWGWLVELLEDYGFAPHLVHPLRCKAIASARLKNDKVDAATLAQLLRADLLPEARIAPQQVRQLRALLRHRVALVRLCTGLRNQIHAGPHGCRQPLAAELVTRVMGGLFSTARTGSPWRAAAIPGQAVAAEEVMARAVSHLTRADFDLQPMPSAMFQHPDASRDHGSQSIGDDVRDATSRVLILWFQQTDPHPTPRQRFHIDVRVPYDVADQRIAAAVAAEAAIVEDSRAPSTTVIADPDGNKACVGTFQPPPQPE
jgi:hypothetical protein